MNMKEKYIEAYKYLNNKKLTTRDFVGTIIVHHEDGSKFLFYFSIFEVKGEFVYLWSEHNGYHIWYMEDISKIEYKKFKSNSKKELLEIVKDFIKSNKISCKKDIDIICPPTGRESEIDEYSANEFIEECCKIIKYNKGEE